MNAQDLKRFRSHSRAMSGYWQQECEIYYNGDRLPGYGIMPRELAVIMKKKILKNNTTLIGWMLEVVRCGEIPKLARV